MFREACTKETCGGYGWQGFDKIFALVNLVVMALVLNAAVYVERAWAQTSSPERPSRSGAQREITKGIFLIADPHLQDPNFRKTVVLVIDHGPDGTLGVVVNRPTTTTLSRLLPDIREFRGQADTLYIGGPVFQQVLLLLLRSRVRIDSASHIIDDVYFTQDMNMLTDTLKKKSPKAAFRVYAGYAGWASGQLQGELDRGDWRIVGADSSVVFEKDPEKVWSEMIRRSSEQLIMGPSGPVRPMLRSDP